MIALLVLIIASTASRADCPEAREAWQADKPPTAEAAARACLEARPGDLEAVAHLAQAVAAQGRHDEALDVLASALAASPDDPGLRLAQARVLWWSGDVSASWEAIRSLPPGTTVDLETRRFRAAVALAVGDATAASEAYETLVEMDPSDGDARWGRARARLLAGDETGAREDLRRACALGVPAACQARKQLAARDAQILASAHATWSAVMDRSDGAALLLAADRQFTKTLRAGAEIEAETRRGGAMSDALLRATGTWDTGRRFLVSGSLGATPFPDFFPTFTTWVEPAWRIGQNLQAGVRAWWMVDSSGSVPVLSPLVERQSGPWLARFRSWHALGTDHLWHHFGLVRLGRELPADVFLEVGAGAGNGADYLVFPATTPDYAWLALVHGSWAATPRMRLRAAASWRNETAGEASYRELRMTTGVEHAF
ncbi:MAG: tetratricopeptide repeat protein [Deltaproteobacteria bacterium]|nr:tetratricopeptide repeat protein [Deltaproteobacteria bacterium]